MRARNLPVMDSASQLTDAYVDVRLDEQTERTPICRKTLNPVWNEDFLFEVGRCLLAAHLMICPQHHTLRN